MQGGYQGSKPTASTFGGHTYNNTTDPYAAEVNWVDNHEGPYRQISEHRHPSNSQRADAFGHNSYVEQHRAPMMRFDLPEASSSSRPIPAMQGGPSWGSYGDNRRHLDLGGPSRDTLGLSVGAPANTRLDVYSRNINSNNRIDPESIDGGGQAADGDEDDDGDADHDDDDRPTKKPRNSLKRGTACARCREKKLKCTGERPVCSVCANSKKKPVSCVYEAMAKRKPKAHKLKTRIQELEDQIREKESHLKELDPPGSSTAGGTPPIMEEKSSRGSTSENASKEHGKRRSVVHPSSQADVRPEGFWPTPTSQIFHSPMQSSARPMSSTMIGRSDTDRRDIISSSSRAVDSTMREPPTWKPKSSHIRSRSDTDDPLSYSQPQNSDIDNMTGNLAIRRSVSNANILSQGLSYGPGNVTVAEGSPVEYALIHLVLPYAPLMSMPMHAGRFLESIKPQSTQRPHPALLYMLFASAVFILTNQIPLPEHAEPVPSEYPQPDSSVYQYLVDLEGVFFDRAKSELEIGIRNEDRLDELTRASAGMARYLVQIGRMIEASSLPFVRLAVACGLHRITSLSIETAKDQPRGPVAPPRKGVSMDYQEDQMEVDFRRDMARDPLSSSKSRSRSEGQKPDKDRFVPIEFRTKVVVIPPPADSIEMWERVETFWAVKELDWGLSTIWGWSLTLADSEIQTPWPKSLANFMSGPSTDVDIYGVWDLMNPGPRSAAFVRPEPRILALQSLSLVSSANRLFDLPKPLSTLDQIDLSLAVPCHRYTLHCLTKLQSALEAFRSMMPASDLLPEDYSSNPCWITTRANLAAADMMCFAEYALYQPAMYEHAVNAARRMVALVHGVQPEIYIHLNCFVYVQVSLVARFLYKEADRLRRTSPHPQAALSAESDADVLLSALEDDIGRWIPLGVVLGAGVRRAKQGVQERSGLYERPS